MARTIVKLAVQNLSMQQEERTVFVGEAIVKKQKMPTDQSITLRFGSNRLEVLVKPVARLTGIRLTPALAAKLGLHHGVKLCLNYKANSRCCRSVLSSE